MREKGTDPVNWILGVALIAAGIKILVTGRVGSVWVPNWAIYGSNVHAGGLLCLISGGTLLIHAFKKRHQMRRKRGTEAKLDETN